MRLPWYLFFGLCHLPPGECCRFILPQLSMRLYMLADLYGARKRQIAGAASIRLFRRGTSHSATVDHIRWMQSEHACAWPPMRHLWHGLHHIVESELGDFIDHYPHLHAARRILSHAQIAYSRGLTHDQPLCSYG